MKSQLTCQTIAYGIQKKSSFRSCAYTGASEGNRTPVSTLARSRSTIELHLQMAVLTRIELAIFSVTGRRDNRYTTGPFRYSGMFK